MLPAAVSNLCMAGMCFRDGKSRPQAHDDLVIFSLRSAGAVRIEVRRTCSGMDSSECHMVHASSGLR
jgi:hypothetical protein